jgi:predicted nucleic acid-binding protein
LERWFIDTSFLIALASSADQHHDRANQLLDQIQNDDVRLVTTSAVLLELGAALSRVAHRAGAMTIIRELQADARVEIINVGDDLLEQGLVLFERRQDKEWSLTDCVSFELMAKFELSHALTADAHFEQAGFVALLRA